MCWVAKHQLQMIDIFHPFSFLGFVGLFAGCRVDTEPKQHSGHSDTAAVAGIAAEQLRRADTRAHRQAAVARASRARWRRGQQQQGQVRYVSHPSTRSHWTTKASGACQQAGGSPFGFAFFPCRYRPSDADSDAQPDGLYATDPAGTVPPVGRLEPVPLALAQPLADFPELVAQKQQLRQLSHRR